MNGPPSAIGTSPKILPGIRQPIVRSMPSIRLVTSILPERTANSARSSPSWTAYSPAASWMSAALLAKFARSSADSVENSGTAASSSVVSMRPVQGQLRPQLLVQRGLQAQQRLLVVQPRAVDQEHVLRAVA